MRQRREPYKDTDAYLCKADFFWPVEGLIVEIQGGTWLRGAKQSKHTRGEGYARDCRKLNAAAQNGYFTLYFTTEMVTKGHVARDTTLALLERLRSS